MADFKAKVRPELHPAAQELVDAYESVPGGKTYPCLPEGIAAVLEVLALQAEMKEQEEHGEALLVPNARHFAALLRGEQP